MGSSLVGRELFYEGGILQKHPWFTGPVLAPSSNALPNGLADLQLDIFQLNRYGYYDRNWDLVRRPVFHSLVVHAGLARGVAENLDLFCVPNFVWNTCRGQQNVDIGDWSVGFDLQLHHGSVSSWIPSVKVGFRQFFPTGRFDHLDPAAFGTQVTGTGCYYSVGGLTIRKLTKFDAVHYLSNILTVRTTFFLPTHVKGLSLYGGALDTHGTIRPGTMVELLLSGEYSLTDNWALALDCNYLHQGADHFWGCCGTNADGTPALVGDPASDLFSFCPALEYNFRLGFGIIGGIWFSVGGRNAPAFSTFAIELVYVW